MLKTHHSLFLLSLISVTLISWFLGRYVASLRRFLAIGRGPIIYRYGRKVITAICIYLKIKEIAFDLLRGHSALLLSAIIHHFFMHKRSVLPTLLWTAMPNAERKLLASVQRNGTKACVIKTSVHEDFWIHIEPSSGKRLAGFGVCKITVLNECENTFTLLE